MSPPATAPIGENREPAAVATETAIATADSVVVAAVVVAHNGARWLPGLISALQGQTRSIDQILAVDTGSRDDSADILRRALGDSAVRSVAREVGFGAAVAGAVAAMSAASPANWLWLIHDDCLPLPDTLEALLAARDLGPDVTVIGPKIRGWSDRTLLLETGVTIARSGRRETGLERNEVDQGQHDETRDVLAVSSAGMLVRRDVWDRLAGFDPKLALFRDDVDFGWRARLAGQRVVVAPDAVVHHVGAASSGRRTIDAATRRRHLLDRRNALHVLLANLPARSLPWAYVRLTITSLLRAFGFALGKLPGAVLDELSAVTSVVLRPDRVLAARRWRRTTRTVAAREVQPYLAPRGAQLTRLLDVLASVFARDQSGGAEVLSRGHRSLETGPAQGDLEDLEPVGLRWVRSVLRPGPVLTVTLLVLSLVAGRHLLGSGRLMDGALLPAPDGARALWRTYIGGWHDVGLGSSTGAPPYLAVVAIVGSMLLGNASLAVDILLIGAVPLAGVTAWLASRRLVRSPRLRVWGAATYALLPATSGAIAGGRLGSAVVIVALPMVALTAAHAMGLVSAGWREPDERAADNGDVPLPEAARRADAGGRPDASHLADVANRSDAADLADAAHLADAADLADAASLPDAADRTVPVDAAAVRVPDNASVSDTARAPQPGSWPAAWACGLVLALCSAFVPVSYAIAAAVLLVSGLTVVRGGGAWARLAVILLVPPAVLLPWSLEFTTNPDMFLMEAGLPGPALSDPHLAPLSVLLQSSGGPGSAPWLLGVPLLLGGLAALLSRHRRGPVLAGWLLAFVGLVAGVGVSFARVSTATSPAPVAGWPGTAVAVVAAGLLLAIVVGADQAGDRLNQRSFGWRQPVAVVVAVVTAAAPLLFAGWWVVRGADEPLSRRDQVVLPEFVAAEGDDPTRPRTIVLRRTADSITYALLRESGPRLGDAETGPPTAAYDLLDAAVADLVSGRGGRDAAVLADHAVQYLLVAAPVDDDLVATLDAVPGLERVSTSNGEALWRLTATAARLRIESASGALVQTLPSGSEDATATVPAGPPGRLVVLAERRSDGWVATLDGARLPSSDASEWAQAFALPTSGGTLLIRYDAAERTRWLLLELVLTGVVVVLSLPGVRRPGVGS